MPAPDVVTFQEVTRPSTTPDGQYAPGIRFGDPRTTAVLSSLVGFGLLLHGFTNRQLVARVSTLLHGPYTPRQATYDLRRLRRKGFLQRIAHTHRHQLTAFGRRIAVLFTKAYGRVLTPGLTALDLQLPETLAQRSPLAMAWRNLDRVFNRFLADALVAA